MAKDLSCDPGLQHIGHSTVKLRREWARLAMVDESEHVVRSWPYLPIPTSGSGSCSQNSLPSHGLALALHEAGPNPLPPLRSRQLDT